MTLTQNVWSMAGVVMRTVSGFGGGADGFRRFPEVPDHQGRFDPRVVAHHDNVAPGLLRGKGRDRLPDQLQQQSRILAARIGDQPRMRMFPTIFFPENVPDAVETLRQAGEAVPEHRCGRAHAAMLRSTDTASATRPAARSISAPVV